MSSDWTYPILVAVFVSWGVGFVGLAAWSIYKEYKAHQDPETETETDVSAGAIDNGVNPCLAEEDKKCAK